MSKMTLLVLGASAYQVNAIEGARRLGYRVITVDNTRSNPGHAMSDRSYNADTTDIETVLRIARAEEVCGVISPCTDVAVPTAAYVAERLGLAGPPYESTKILCSKIAFRQFMEKNGFPTPPAISVTVDSAPAPGLFDGRTWIIKPDKSSGSKGVFILSSEEDFGRRLPESCGHSLNRRASVERYIVGHQGTCEAVLVDGDIALSWVMDRQTAPPPYAATHAHFVPTRLPPAAQSRLRLHLKRACDLLGLRNGPLDCDFVVADGEVFLLEMTPRMGGNSLSALIQSAAGFDLVHYSIQQACGRETHPPAPAGDVKPWAVILLGAMKSGRLRFDPVEAESLSREPWVHSLTFDIAAGERVEPFINGRHRVGEAIIKGRDRSDLDAKARELKRRLNIDAA